jgi:TolA-binding protein
VTGDPTKLTVVGATDLERRLLDAAAGEQPPAELSARMRLGLGLAPFAPPPPAAPSTASSAAAPVAAAKTGAAGWVAAGLVAAAVTGGVVLSRFQTPVPAPRTAALAIAAPVAPADEAAPVVHAAPHAERAGRVHHRAAAPTPAGPGMRGEIALVDAARTAVKSGDPERALALLHRYDTTFPAGAFRPEVAALCIEAFAADGQTDLARARARDFIAAHPESPLSARLARIAGVR